MVASKARLFGDDTALSAILALEQKQRESAIRPIIYISRATLVTSRTGLLGNLKLVLSPGAFVA